METTTIELPVHVRDALRQRKRHPRQPYYEVIEEGLQCLSGEANGPRSTASDESRQRAACRTVSRVGGQLMKFAEEGEAVVRDVKTYWACLHGLRRMALAIQDVPEHLKRDRTDVPWFGIQRLPQLMEWEGVDESRVWDLLQNEVPRLVGACQTA